jgi:hypothetical protein
VAAFGNERCRKLCSAKSPVSATLGFAAQTTNLPHCRFFSATHFRRPLALHSGKQNEAVQLYAFDIMALDGEHLRGLPLSMRKTNLALLLARRPDGIFVAPFEQGEIGPDLFRSACDMGLEGLISRRRREGARSSPDRPQ